MQGIRDNAEGTTGILRSYFKSLNHKELLSYDMNTIRKPTNYYIHIDNFIYTLYVCVYIYLGYVYIYSIYIYVYLSTCIYAYIKSFFRKEGSSSLSQRGLGNSKSEGSAGFQRLVAALGWRNIQPPGLHLIDCIVYI